MKKNLVFFALILMALVSCSKLQSNEKKFLKGMQSEDYEESSQAFNDFCEWMENDSETMTHDFNLMREKKCKIREISNILNFPTQSFFGRFFKRTTGMSPKKYTMIHFDND